MSSGPSPVTRKAASSDCHGNPSWCLMRVNRSSPAAYRILPSSTMLTVASLSRGDKPNTLITSPPTCRFSSKGVVVVPPSSLKK